MNRFVGSDYTRAIHQAALSRSRVLKARAGWVEKNLLKLSVGFGMAAALGTLALTGGTELANRSFCPSGRAA